MNNQPQVFPHLVSHGLCPDCCAVYAQSRPVPDSLRNARILRTMIQGNLDMAARLIQIGDTSMALAELTQAIAKIDQTLNALAQ